MPRGFVGKSVKKFFTNTEEALDRAGNAHNRNPFDSHRTNHSVPLPNLPPINNQPVPFTPADAKSGGPHARGAGDSSNVVVDPDILDNIARRMEMIDRQATDDMCRVADEIEEMCSTIFVVPETAVRIRSLCDEFKRTMHQARYVTEDTAIDVRKFVNEVSSIDHGNPGEIAMSRSGADQAIQRVSSSMDRQISNMERTANNYKTQSQRLDSQAERERRRAEQLASQLSNQL